jgi:hypothetical protein
MNVSIWQILIHTPLWLWGLLATLLVLGVLQHRPRQIARWQLLALPPALLLPGRCSLTRLRGTAASVVV